uniref:Uncharacterized protein n=1 Tax=Nelumbo nucifera TaxID=4432 RepID=A0A822XS03_NELNU|nr:TPA_asm: hypothetical protein HUJ06_023364 [Nelumbo nucifera]
MRTRTYEVIHGKNQKKIMEDGFISALVVSRMNTTSCGQIITHRTNFKCRSLNNTAMVMTMQAIRRSMLLLLEYVHVVVE